MYWNYRIVHTSEQDEDMFEVREVYYDEEGRPYAHGSSAVLNEAEEGVKGIGRVLTMMRRALKQPVLEDADFHHKEEP